MSIVLVGSTSGSCTLQEQAVAGTTVLTLPTTSGTVALTSQLPTSPSAAGQIPFSTDGSTYTPTDKIVSGTAVASTSGTSIDFTSIPSWVKRITVMFKNVSTNGTSYKQIQLGAGSVTTTGYQSSCSLIYGSNLTAIDSITSGFLMRSDVAAEELNGHYVFTLIGNAYIAKRAAEFPPITDYIDGVVKGDQAQIDKYIADCLAVKARHKGSSVNRVLLLCLF
jgi:hypothetical protein